MAKLCPKIILEGTRLTFKTEIAFALNEHPHIVGPRRYRYHVFCTRTPESFAAARAERLKVAGNPSQYADLQVFIQEQKVMRRLVGESILPTLELDISDNDVHKASDRIADWLAETGGFWAPTL
jgi:hypothetical protein